MSWDDPFYTGGYPADAYDDEPGNPFVLRQNANGGGSRPYKMHATTPEAGMRYEQAGVPAAAEAPNCNCGNCPWKTNAMIGAQLLAMPKTSLDMRSDMAMLKQYVMDTISAQKESMSTPSRNMTIVPEVLDFRMFLILFIIVIMIYMFTSLVSSLNELRKAVEASNT